MRSAIWGPRRIVEAAARRAPRPERARARRHRCGWFRGRHTVVVVERDAVERGVGVHGGRQRRQELPRRARRAPFTPRTRAAGGVTPRSGRKTCAGGRGEGSRGDLVGEVACGGRGGENKIEGGTRVRLVRGEGRGVSD